MGSTASSGYAPDPFSTPPPAKSGGNSWLLCCAIFSILFVPWWIGVPLGICLGIAWYQGKQKAEGSRPKAPQTW